MAIAGDPQVIFDNANVSACRHCGAAARLSWKQGGFRVECERRFMDCPMNARTHSDPDIHVVIERWEAKPKNG